MSKYKNLQKEVFVKSIPDRGLEDGDDILSVRCKFNFHYFQPQAPGQDWSDWDHAALVKLLSKLKAYSECSLAEWENSHAGRGGRVLSIYDAFPSKSDFAHPKAIPHDVRWARFRLEQKVRLVGFVVPSALNGVVHCRKKVAFCSNTFYVVFLDRDHRFYLTEKA